MAFVNHAKSFVIGGGPRRCSSTKAVIPVAIASDSTAAAASAVMRILGDHQPAGDIDYPTACANCTAFPVDAVCPVKLAGSSPLPNRYRRGRGCDTMGMTRT